MKRIQNVTWALGLALLLGACSSSLNFQTSSVVPAASGKVDVQRDRNENYTVRVNVRNLAPPDRLTPPQPYYVVWMESKQGTTRKLGLLNPSSRQLKASLRTSVVEQPARVFVTAENSTDSAYPAGTEVLATNRR